MKRSIAALAAVLLVACGTDVGAGEPQAPQTDEGHYVTSWCSRDGHHRIFMGRTGREASIFVTQENCS